MQRISITLDSEETAALILSARADYRHPREQLRYIMRRELERRGLLPAADGAADYTEVRHATAN